MGSHALYYRIKLHHFNRYGLIKEKILWTTKSHGILPIFDFRYGCLADAQRLAFLSPRN